MLVYSEQSGRYELLDTASLSKGEKVKRVDALARNQGDGDRPDKAQSEADGDETENTDDKEDSFSIAWGINRSLNSEERQGFLLIALAGGAGVAGLTLLYTKLRRRK